MARGTGFAAAGIAMLLTFLVPNLAIAGATSRPGTSAPAMTMHGADTGGAMMHARSAPAPTTTTMMPTEPGQGAFGALQQIVRILEADPRTDWSKVDLDALRAHLIDMNRVTLDAAAKTRPIPGGIRATVTGTGRTLLAIHRLLPEEAMHLNGMRGWRIVATSRADGVVLTVTTRDPKQVAMIRGLGFAGILASGDFHPMHHLEIARGEPMH
ncbi:MAG: hypothetical protein KGI51_02725 [Rhodospirillales bacterium]|nr:hypothetical protein [Rhodospirillales bacterium]